MSKRHLFLKNEKSTNPTFNRKRGFSSNERESEEPEEQEEEKVLDSTRISQFRTYYRQFNSDRESRRGKRTIEFPSVIDLVEISFFKTFNNELRKSHSFKSTVWEDVNSTRFPSIVILT
jgi:hypothetical protein